MLEGKVVEGKHERMISKDDFFKIHNLRVESTRFGVSHKKENDDLPLKVFLKCDDCKQAMTGYIEKRKIFTITNAELKVVNTTRVQRICTRILRMN